MCGNQRGAALLGVGRNTRHGEIIDAHAVGEANALVFNGSVILVVMAAEHSLCATELYGSIEELARII